MEVRSSILIPRPPSAVWPLLCSSRMDPAIPCMFRLGIPKPVECRLPEGEGGVGRARECVSDRGVIRQRITHWEVPRLLRFEMVDSTLYFRPFVSGIREEFLLEPAGPEGVRLTRTTQVGLTGRCRIAKSLLMWAGVRAVHRYVFKNWVRLAIRGSGG